jgi:hypothetical protein
MEKVETGGSDDAEAAFHAANMIAIDNKTLFIFISTVLAALESDTLLN